MPKEMPKSQIRLKHDYRVWPKNGGPNSRYCNGHTLQQRAVPSFAPGYILINLPDQMLQDVFYPIIKAMQKSTNRSLISVRRLGMSG